jgi:hypothetical protein
VPTLTCGLVRSNFCFAIPFLSLLYAVCESTSSLAID